MRTIDRLAAIATTVLSVATIAVIGVGRADAAPAGGPSARAANCADNGTALRPSREEVLRRARSWLHGTRSDTSYDPVDYQGDFVPYTQGSCHTNNYGSYRQDCSGFLALAWGLGGRGDAYYTGNLRPSSTSPTTQIGQTDLAPGDALLFHVANSDPNDDHAALFVRWISGVGGTALVYEQTGATDRPRVAVWSAGKVDGYTPIRLKNLGNTLVSGQGGKLNLITSDGALNWYHHTGWYDGNPTWAPVFQTGVGWHGFDKVVASDRTLFAAGLDGILRWYRYDTDQGWDPASGTSLGVGWNGFKFLFSGGSGILYGVTWGGELRWYRYTGTPGRGGSYVAGSGRALGVGWHGFRAVFASQGTIYGVGHDGSVRWYRYLTPFDGSGPAYAPGAGTTVASGWVRGTCGYQAYLPAGDGRIYAVGADRELRWRRHLDPTSGGTAWNAPCGQSLGVGWL